jgi:hypothetical protein
MVGRGDLSTAQWERPRLSYGTCAGTWAIPELSPDRGDDGRPGGSVNHSALNRRNLCQSQGGKYFGSRRSPTRPSISCPRPAVVRPPSGSYRRPSAVTVSPRSTPSGVQITTGGQRKFAGIKAMHMIKRGNWREVMGTSQVQQNGSTRWRHSHQRGKTCLVSLHKQHPKIIRMAQSSKQDGAHLDRMSSGLRTAPLPLIIVIFENAFEDAAHRSPKASAGTIIRVSLIYQVIFGDCPDRHSPRPSTKMSACCTHYPDPGQHQ